MPALSFRPCDANADGEWEQNVGPSELTRFILNVQPVMPFSVNEDVNLIVRLIAPLVGQPPLVDGGTATFGMGDITTSFFVSPSKATRLIWGDVPAAVRVLSGDAHDHADAAVGDVGQLESRR